MSTDTAAILIKARPDGGRARRCWLHQPRPAPRRPALLPVVAARPPAPPASRAPEHPQVLEAWDLPGADADNLSDMYCTLAAGAWRVSTKAARRTPSGRSAARQPPPLLLPASSADGVLTIPAPPPGDPEGRP